MSNWKSCVQRFPNKFQLSNDEQDHLYCLFSNYFATHTSGSRIIFANWNRQAVYSWGVGCSWKFLSNNVTLNEEDLQSDYTNLEHIQNFDLCKGTATFLEKNIKWDNSSDSWKYLNNQVVNFESTSKLQSSEEQSKPEGDDTAKVEEILERTETTVATTIQKLKQISSQSQSLAPSSPAQEANTLPRTTQAPTQASSLPTPPVSKGKQPAQIPPWTRTPTSRSSVPKASTSQGPVQAPPPQPAAPWPPPGNPPPNPPAPAAMAQQNQPWILGTAPDPYDGSPQKAIAFWNTLANYYTINKGVYTTNAQKVSSALTHFKIGTPAGNWASDPNANSPSCQPT